MVIYLFIYFFTYLKFVFELMINLGKSVWINLL